MRREVLVLFALVLSLSSSLALSRYINVSTAVGNGTGTLPNTLLSNDNSRYYVGQRRYVQVNSFITGSNTGNILSVNLKIRYHVQSGYNGNNSFIYSLDGGSTWSNSSIKPLSTHTSEKEYSSSILSVSTWSAINNVRVRFDNNAELSRTVYIDQLYLEVISGCGDLICESGEACIQDCNTERYCTDGVDNNENGFTDTQDYYCGGLETSCYDGIDNDGDTLIDCQDSSDCVQGISCGSDKLCCSSSCVIPTCSSDSDCEDGNSCTINTCSNDGTCSSSCISTPVINCVTGDGCCPAGCTILNDGECTDTCGDNICQSNENCNSCPNDCACLEGSLCCNNVCLDICYINSDCEDGNACTTNVCTNSGTCNALCTYTSINYCYGGDGCCPASCNSINDVDCLTSCGDTICSTGETCSNCPADCGCGYGELCCQGNCFDPCGIDDDCSDDNACTIDTCNNPGICNSLCTHTSILVCSSGDGCCPAGCTYALDLDCPEGCGNGVCENEESCTSCPTDCGKCEMECGDGFCDIKETCTSCPDDCGECTVEVISASPSNGTVYNRGDEISLSISFSRSVDNVYATLGDATNRLNIIDSMNYEGSISVSSELNGSYLLDFSYYFNNIEHHEFVNITIDPTLKVFINVNNNSYVKSDTIIISGYAKDLKDNLIIDGVVSINLTSSDWIYKINTITDENGFFNESFLISFADPTGDWVISASLIDENENEGINFTQLSVSFPKEHVYNVRFYSPLAGGKYYRGQTIIVTVEVTKGSQPISDANVNAISPSGTILNFTEQTNGLYTAEYTIPLNEPTGTWSVSTQAVKYLVTGVEGGGDYLNIQVEPLVLRLELLEPLSTTFNLNEAIEFILKATYPDGLEIDEANVGLMIGNNSFLLLPKGSGRFSTTINPDESMEGAYTAIFTVDDFNGNKGVITKVFNFFEPPWYIKYILYVITVSLLLSLLIVSLSYKRIDYKIKVNRLAGYKEEISRISKMKELSEVQYFHKKIDEETYLNLMRGYESRLIDLSSKIEFLEKKLSKIPIQKKEERESNESFDQEADDVTKAKQLLDSIKDDLKKYENKHK